MMLTEIEDIVVREMSGLCGSCVHYEGCVYRLSTRKVIIQCEVFENCGDGETTREETAVLKGLCVNCSKSFVCHLPKEASGVWHCEEYE